MRQRKRTQVHRVSFITITHVGRRPCTLSESIGECIVGQLGPNLSSSVLHSAPVPSVLHSAPVPLPVRVNFAVVSNITALHAALDQSALEIQTGKSLPHPVLRLTLKFAKGLVHIQTQLIVPLILSSHSACTTG